MVLVLALGAALAAVAGCGQQQAGKPGGAMQVKAMKAMQQDTRLVMSMPDR